MSQSAFFPVKPSVYLYSDRKLRACQKLGNGPGGWQMPSPRAVQNLQMPHLTRLANVPQYPGGGEGGAERSWNWSWLMHKHLVLAM